MHLFLTLCYNTNHRSCEAKNDKTKRQGSLSHQQRHSSIPQGRIHNPHDIATFHVARNSERLKHS